MNHTRIIIMLLVIILTPFLLANQSCERSTTWGEKYFTKWESDHVDIDKDTKCIDCHDDIKNTKVKPLNHDATWKREHGKFESQRYGFKNENVCSLCHTEAQCTKCHQQEAPQQHTEFWKQRGHGVFVGLDRSSCMTCHNDAQFCERCHRLTEPRSHTAGWGATTNRHCNSCHFPLTAAGGQQCAVCHAGTPSHNSTPSQPSDALHVTGANCAGCHTSLRHPDNGMACTICHTQ
ncbi:MAG: hypothetical protein A3G32_01195 [Deltaproteobacteria bacterium RIFCSPLOWO2_12_FULL_40_28]|nr:MAG: hypothetical protein A3C45_10080 [Deltaproteobacteria bacterium RIFCSPHIGHO2_02_FULL_40_28]OGQ19946.1 MAG: hypothetical protein A3E27_07030 [Deltaproteobacteria bacterium RIFCSPHIGHO2_12_FULL_40_32]OGQ39705.1 MAG: hypothetical protein A3I69_06460 [Deltaproteobacteria bacterium RIFCSPLOWO2_02_FULL_40_36]OGQ52960.1 MAG: hypothetical protein A3G32_01195 [Deltaproteobacteria bacterium RIFCSPLOWO2_12_FULL_40_28]